MAILQVAEAKGCRDLRKAPRSKAAISGTLVYHKITYVVRIYAVVPYSVFLHHLLARQHLRWVHTCFFSRLIAHFSPLPTRSHRRAPSRVPTDLLQEGGVPLQRPVRQAQRPDRRHVQQERPAAAGR